MVLTVFKLIIVQNSVRRLEVPLNTAPDIKARVVLVVFLVVLVSALLYYVLVLLSSISAQKFRIFIT